MDKEGLRSWVEKNQQAGEQVLWVGSPRLVFFRGLFFTRVIPGVVMLGLAVWFYCDAPGMPLPDWALFLTNSFPKDMVLALGLLFTVLPLVRAYMLRHTRYIITNRRVLKARIFTNRVRQWPLSLVARARRIDYADGVCTYLFDEWENTLHRHERISRGIYFVPADFNEALKRALSSLK